MKTLYSPTMTPNAHERAEWQRLALAAYDCDRTKVGARFNVAASDSSLLHTMPIHDFDEMQAIYRQWLVYGFTGIADLP